MASASGQGERSAYRWYVVAVCTVAYVFSFVDRQIMTLLIEPIRADLALTDTQFGLLHGLAFALFYATLGIPIAQASDSHSRPRIIASGVFVWSAATALCSVARNFVQLFVSRIAVGAGEAALTPATYSMLADYFPRDQLGRAAAVYATGSMIGAGVAFLSGGVLVSLVPRLGLDAVPGIGALRPWQAIFGLAGLPGVAVAVVIGLTVRDPPRRQSGDNGARFADVVVFCASHRATIAAHFIGYSLSAIALFQLLAWGPAILIRTYGLSVAESGYVLGVLTLAASTTGVLCSGWLHDALLRRGRVDAPMLTGVWGAMGLLVATIALASSATIGAAIVRFAAALFFASFPIPPSTTALQLLAPSRMRARLTAMFLFCNSLVGLALGSALVGVLNDRIFGTAAVMRSVTLVVGGAAITAGLVLAAGMPAFRKSLNRIASATSLDE